MSVGVSVKVSVRVLAGLPQMSVSVWVCVFQCGYVCFSEGVLMSVSVGGLVRDLVWGNEAVKQKRL